MNVYLTEGTQNINTHIDTLKCAPTYTHIHTSIERIV